MHQFSIETRHNLGIPHVKKPPYDIWLCLKMGYTSKIPISRGTNDYYPLNFGVCHFQTNQGFEVLQTHKSLAGTSQHARLTPPEIQVTIRFHSGFQALVDVRSDKLAWIRIVHNAVLQPELRWMPKAFKQAKRNWPPILEEEISRHKPEKVSLTKWIQWQRKRRTRVANPSSGNRKPRNQPYFATNSTKKKAQGVYHIEGVGTVAQACFYNTLRDQLACLKRKFLWRKGMTCAEGCAWHGCLLQSIHIAKEGYRFSTSPRNGQECTPFCQQD